MDPIDFSHISAYTLYISYNYIKNFSLDYIIQNKELVTIIILTLLDNIKVRIKKLISYNIISN